MEILRLVLILFFTNTCYSQGVVSNNCNFAIELCNGDQVLLGIGVSPSPTIPSFGSISNPSVNPNSGNAGCLPSGELNPNWFIITIESTGTLEFDFSIFPGGSGFLDWIMWPYDSIVCQSIVADTIPPLACNSNSDPDGLTGMAEINNIPTGGSPGNFETPISVVAGEQFLICVSNFSSVVGNLNFNNFGSAGICQSTMDFSDELTLKERKLVKVVDFLGRETESEPNKVLIYIYDDGSCEKLFQTE